MNTLFNQSRRTDPETSRIAAGNAADRSACHRELCLRVVAKRPGMTAAEIAEYIGLERHIPSRRLPELRRAALVESRSPRLCRCTGNMSMTWWPAATERAL